MPENKPPRGKTHGDVERIAAGKKHRTPAGGVPIDVDSEEHTPPPQPPPTQAELSDYPQDEQLEILREAVSRNNEAVERLWDQRHVGDKIDVLLKDMATVSTTVREFIKPSIGALMSRMGTVEQTVTSNAARQSRFWDYEWPQAMKSLENLGSHMERVEKDVDRVERTVDGLSKKVDEMGSQANRRFDELKQTDDKQETRLRALEDFKLSLTTKITLIATAAGAVVGFGTVIAEHLFFK